MQPGAAYLLIVLMALAGNKHYITGAGCCESLFNCPAPVGDDAVAFVLRKRRVKTFKPKGCNALFNLADNRAGLLAAGVALQKDYLDILGKEASELIKQKYAWYMSRFGYR